MKATGIVAEYNPFHQGHAYQIEQIREKLNPDVVIAVMSGNFLQRGEPAIVDKWTRTHMALYGGIDLVVELPVVFSTQPADYFAQGALHLFRALDIDTLSFGVEAGTQDNFKEAARWMVQNEERLAAEIQKAETFDVPYAKQMAELVADLAPAFPIDLSSPNNQLGFAYTKEIVANQWGNDIDIFPVKRKEAAYHEPTVKKDKHIASATALRRELLLGNEVAPYIPDAAYASLKEADAPLVTWEDYFPFLDYQLTVHSAAELKTIYQMTEGLENRLQAAIPDTTDFSEFMEGIKTKRYTQTRLQRLLTYTLFQWQAAEINQALDEGPQALRVLGFNQTGQAYLSEIKNDLPLPLITNVNQNNANYLDFDIKAGEIYRLGNKALISKQDFTRKPIRID